MKKLLSVLLSMTLLLSILTFAPFGVFAVETTFEEPVGESSGTTGECIWTLDDDGTLTIFGDGEMGSYASSSDAIAPWGTSIKRVVIEDGVTNIGSNAFYKSSGLKNVTIGKSVSSIDYHAFANCTGLTSVEIPNSITSVVGYAFSDCTGLTSVTIGKSVSNFNRTAFSGCTELTCIKVDGENPFYDSRDNCNAIIKTNINELVFGCKTTVIPDSVKSIGDYAFYDCTGLTSVKIPSSVKTIGNSTFRGCTGLTRVDITDIAAWCGIQFFGYYSNPVSFAHNLYINGELVTNLIIPDSVTSISHYAFYRCTGLTSVKIGKSVTYIDYGAFSNCTGLTNVEISSSVKTIRVEAFFNCTGLTSVTIPSSVSSIDEKVFAGCKDLTLYVEKDSNAERYANKNNIPYKYLSSGTTGDCTWTLFDNHLTISGSGAMSDTPTAAPWGTEVESAVIEDGVTNIRSYAFFSCKQLTETTIPESVTSIGKWAFYNCSALESLTIPASVTEIGDKAFNGCADGFTIYSYGGSFAETYANDNGINFVSLNPELTTEEPTTEEPTTEEPTTEEPTTAPVSVIIPGDLNGDGKVDITDATVIQKTVAELFELSDEQKKAADTNADGKVDITDATMIQKYLAQLIDHLG